jgi:halimadienyl-diphosphate synthase
MDGFREALDEIGSGKNISRSAYDTAWLARLDEQAPDLSQPALEWLSENQNADGSWGAWAPEYYSDRLICTLAAVTALARSGRRTSDRRLIQRGTQTLGMLISGATRNLAWDNTIGFELIAPTLVCEAETLGIIPHQSNHFLGKLVRERNKKLSSLPSGMVNRTVTVAFSAEMAGTDEQHLLDIPNLPEGNGSISFSPSATAYYTRYVCAYPPALEYLRSVVKNGAAPYTCPIDVFEIAWSYWNLILAGHVEDLKDRKETRFLQDNWQVNLGAAPDSGLSLVDGDTTSMVFSVLSQLGRQPDLPTLLTYEIKDHFRCYWLESNHSISTNIHALGALREIHNDEDPAVQKILKFLYRTRTPEGYWFDKWHVSPYYTTAHALISCQGLAPEIVEKAGEWFLATQDQNGAWGVYSGMPTAEETAYALQALVIWRRNGGKVTKKALQRGAAWLEDHRQLPNPLLWIGKVLYCPEVIVRTAILSALEMVQQEL